MSLYLQIQLESFAIKKWGSLEAIKSEIALREAQLEKRKEKKFKTKMIIINALTVQKFICIEGPGYVQIYSV